MNPKIMLNTKFPVAFAYLFFFMVMPVAAQRLSALSYVEANKDKAIAFMHEFGLPASIILAVAMHESAHGNSKIARYLNNHFGIKGRNSSRRIRSAYKGYGSVEESYLDFVHCLQTRPAFQQLFDKYQISDYQGWAKGIARGGYAGSRSWARQVINMIERYHLYELDSIPDNPESSIAANDPAEEPSQGETSVYFVKKGDTLSEIADECGLSVDDIREKNGLTTSHLQIGQKLLL